MGLVIPRQGLECLNAFTALLGTKKCNFFMLLSNIKANRIKNKQKGGTPQ